MELTPQVFRDVQFREKLRGGYHPEDVDEFLEEAARAAEDMEGRLKAALERAERAERALGDATASDETLKRVLVMAQRTADETVREAQDEAERIVAEARLKAQSILADGEERGRRAYETKLVEARANLERTEEALRRAQSDAEVVARWVGANKAQLVQALREAADSLERVGTVEEPPALRLPRQEAEPAGQEHAGDVGTAANTSYAGTSGSSGPPPGPIPATGSASPAPGRDAPSTSNHHTGSSGPPEAGGPSAEGPAGEWDPRFLEDLDEGLPRGQASGQGAAGAGGPATGPGGSGAPLRGAFGGGEDTQPGGSVPASSGKQAEAGPGDETVAFDEEALDSFFRDQDLHVKGPGRFRRRS